MKGIVLAGGSGTRLFPATRVVSKQLVPVYDKPMIYYPLSTLLLAGIKDILVISTPQDLPRFEELLGDGSWLGVSFSYKAQPRPEGLPQAYILGREFLDGGPSCLILGDNIFYGHGFYELLRDAAQLTEGGLIFGYRVSDPERSGVVEFDATGRVLSIEEKPKQPKSDYAIPGLFFYDGRVSDLAEGLKPSARGELEITDIHKAYMAQGKLRAEKIGRGIAWLDTGTHESLLQAGNFIQVIEERQGLKVACLEEIAYRQGWIDAAQVEKLAAVMKGNAYGRYLERMLKDA